MSLIYCKYCSRTRSEENFQFMSVPYKGKLYRRKKCVDCYKKQRNSPEYRLRNNERRRTDEFREKKRKYRKLESTKIKMRQYDMKTLSDPFKRAKKNLRSRLRVALKVKKWLKTTRFYEYIGCSQEELKAHLEAKFQLGMTWENYGQWHIDHIIPLSTAKTEEELYKLCHYNNLQPLWASENQKKSNKINHITFL